MEPQLHDMILQCAKHGSNLFGCEGTTSSLLKFIDDVIDVVFKVLDWFFNKLLETAEIISDLIEIL